MNSHDSGTNFSKIGNLALELTVVVNERFSKSGWGKRKIRKTFEWQNKWNDWNNLKTQINEYVLPELTHMKFTTTPFPGVHVTLIQKGKQV